MAAIGIDLGGTKIYGVRVKGTEVAAEAKGKTPIQGGPLAIVDAMADVVRELGGAKAAPDGIGVGAPGVIDTATGVIRVAPNLPGWIEPFGLAAALAEATGASKVLLDNDVN